MSRTIIARYVNPWKFKREQDAERVQALRARDGEDCRRCRRPMRFDLPRGQDLGAAIESVVPPSAGGTEALDNLCLCHRRCNGEPADHTQEVQQRIRMKNEAALLSRSRSRSARQA